MNVLKSVTSRPNAAVKARLATVGASPTIRPMSIPFSRLACAITPAALSLVGIGFMSGSDEAV